MKTIEEIVSEFKEFEMYTPEIYEGIMTRESWYAWKRRGLPKNVVKYFKILKRLEELQQRKKDLNANGWGSSNNHTI